MSQRPVNPLEIKNQFHKASTELNAALETLFQYLTTTNAKLNENNNVLNAEIQAKNAEIARLRKELDSKKGAKKVKADDAVTPKK